MSLELLIFSNLSFRKKRERETEREMERVTAVRNPHTSTADLLTWSEAPPSASANGFANRSYQPSDGISKIIFGGQITDEEAESLNRRNYVKCSSCYRMHLRKKQMKLMQKEAEKEAATYGDKINSEVVAKHQ